MKKTIHSIHSPSFKNTIFILIIEKNLFFLCENKKISELTNEFLSEVIQRFTSSELLNISEIFFSKKNKKKHKTAQPFCKELRIENEKHLTFSFI